MSRIPAPVRSGFASFLKSRLPLHTKRVLFLASFSAGVARYGMCKPNNSKYCEVNPETLKKLNSLFNLCRREKAMKFSATISQVIWDDQVINDLSILFNTHETDSEMILSSIVEKIKLKIPTWLQYGDDNAGNNLEKDLRLLIQNRGEIFG